MNFVLDLAPQGKSGKQRRPPTKDGDPLTEAQAVELLPVVDVIRDPLHGDIHLTKLERRIIESPDFQRLHNIYQLGMTFVAYPSAIHNRFIHSLGTLHVCSEMIATCNRNAILHRELAPIEDPRPVRIHNYAALLARTCALLHDMAHVPFGHTFEKEAQIFKLDEWQDPKRAERLLGNNSQVARIIRDVFKAELGLEHPVSADRFREEILQILKTKRKDVESLPYPFIHDLVGNTICADLVDYVQRDMYFAGLTERFGTRFLEYLAVFPLERASRPSTDDVSTEDKLAGFTPVRQEGDTADTPAFRTRGQKMCRVVLMQYRYNERKDAVEKHGVFEEAIDLIRRRYSVAEKLYFHRTKMAAAAMLAEAAYGEDLDADKIWDLTDVAVIKHLQENGKNQRAKEIAKKLRERRIFKPIYKIGYHEKDGSAAETAVNKACDLFNDPKERSRVAQQIERIIQLHLPAEKAADAIGTCVISCPHRDMNIKQFDMLVLPSLDKTVQTLNVSYHPPTAREIQAIHGRHHHLWHLTVLVDPEVVNLRDKRDDFASQLAGAIQHEIGPPTILAAFANTPSHGNLNDLENKLSVPRFIRDYGVDPNKIQVGHLEDLKSAAFRKQDLSARRDVIRSFLVSNGCLNFDESGTRTTPATRSREGN